MVTNNNTVAIASPVNGFIKPLDEVNDAAFSQKMIGDGVSVTPTDGVVVSPIDGTVMFVMETGHAYGIRSNEGVEILIHIGIDTVNLKGEHFYPHVAKDMPVKKGQLIATFDFDWLKKHDYDLDTMIVVPELNDYRIDTTNKGEKVIGGESTAMNLYKV